LITFIKLSCLQLHAVYTQTFAVETRGGNNLKILFAAELFPFCDAAGELQIQGGGEINTYALARELSNSNQVAVLTSEMPESTYPNDLFPFAVHSVYNGKTVAQRPENLRYAVRLSRELKRLSQEFDVIVPQTFVPVLSTLLGRVKKPVVPLVYDVYQPLPFASGVAAWRDLQNGSLARGLQGSLLERVCLYYAATCPLVITISKASSDTLECWIPRNKIRLTGCGIYLDEYRAGPKDIDVVCIARFDVPYKNVDLVCDALFDSNIRTFVIGEGKLRGKIEHEYGGKNICFTGAASESDKKALLARSRVLVSASSVEGFGITLLEGLASGCLVAASDIGAHRFVDRGSGVIQFFDVGDSIAIKSVVTELLHLSDRDVSIRQSRGIELIKRYWLWGSVARKTEVLLKSVVPR
jgi:glycosyltransferase involved in cell wall biosynthesis